MWNWFWICVVDMLICILVWFWVCCWRWVCCWFRFCDRCGFLVGSNCWSFLRFDKFVYVLLSVWGVVVLWCCGLCCCMLWLNWVVWNVGCGLKVLSYFLGLCDIGMFVVLWDVIDCWMFCLKVCWVLVIVWVCNVCWGDVCVVWMKMFFFCWFFLMLGVDCGCFVGRVCGILWVVCCCCWWCLWMCWWFFVWWCCGEDWMRFWGFYCGWGVWLLWVLSLWERGECGLCWWVI